MERFDVNVRTITASKAVATKIIPIRISISIMGFIPEAGGICNSGVDNGRKNNKLVRMDERNGYEDVFEGWLDEKGVKYVPVDQQKRKIFARNKIKSFDFIVYPRGGGQVIAEVKGREFNGTSLAGMKNLECWVTLEDVKSLIQWELVFEKGTRAVFVFVYKITGADVETDGVEVFEFFDERYFFYAVSLDDYREFMKVRSPKWETVTLPASKFREFAVEGKKFFTAETAEDAED